jgi:hypothetical protein
MVASNIAREAAKAVSKHGTGIVGPLFPHMKVLEPNFATSSTRPFPACSNAPLRMPVKTIQPGGRFKAPSDLGNDIQYDGM